MGNDFLDEFDDNNEADDDTLQALIDYVNETCKPLKDGDTIIRMTNVDRTVTFHTAFNVMKQIIRGKDVVVAEISHQPISSAGMISVTGKNIRITRPDAFSSVLKLASNAEILPKLDGSVEINITFYDLLFELRDGLGKDNQGQ